MDRGPENQTNPFVGWFGFLLTGKANDMNFHEHKFRYLLLMTAGSNEETFFE